MYPRQFLTFFVVVTLTVISAQVYAAPPATPTVLNKELNDLNNVENNNKPQREKTQEDLLAVDDESSSSASSSRSYEHRDEDQLNNATNLVLAQNLKYDVEILESNDNDDNRYQNKDEEVEERFRGDGLKMTDTIYAQNIEVEPDNVSSVSIRENHLVLSIVMVTLALVSVGLYAVLVIWRSHLEQRYGMRQLLVSSGDDEQQQQQSQSEPPHPYPSNPTTTRSNNHYTLVQA